MFFHLIFLLILYSCSSINEIHKKRLNLRLSFDQLQEESNIWNNNISENLKISIKEFKSQKKLENNTIYGEFSKKLNLSKSNMQQIIELANMNRCNISNSFIRDSKSNNFVIYKNKKIPMTIIRCPDGSIVRLKLKGNPLNKFRPWPHGVKSVLYPYNSKKIDFINESFKVDNDGNPIPKWPKDLNDKINPDAWAEDAHTDL